MKSKLKATQYKSSLLIPTLIGAALVASLVFGVLFYGKRTTDNYAKDVAQPLEEALVKIGAVHKCSTGDAGRGPDNIEPHYGATYQINLNKEKTVSLAYSIASQNGYKLVHASPTNRGSLDSVADIYIDNWYFDNTSKDSPYTDLEKGKINLTVTVNAHGDDKVCGKNTHITVDDNHSVIGIGVQLPRTILKQ